MSAILFPDGSKCFLSLIGVVLDSPVPINTESASGLNRVPLQVRHGSLPKKNRLPVPLQVGQAPAGLLKENRRGSSSGNENPS